MIKASIICVINVHVSGPKNVSPERFHVFELRQFFAGLNCDVLTNFIANISLYVELLVIRFFRPDPNIKALLLYFNITAAQWFEINIEALKDLFLSG